MVHAFIKRQKVYSPALFNFLLFHLKCFQVWGRGGGARPLVDSASYLPPHPMCTPMELLLLGKYDQFAFGHISKPGP